MGLSGPRSGVGADWWGTLAVPVGVAVRPDHVLRPVAVEEGNRGSWLSADSNLCLGPGRLLECRVGRHAAELASVPQAQFRLDVLAVRLDRLDRQVQSLRDLPRRQAPPDQLEHGQIAARQPLAG